MAAGWKSNAMSVVGASRPHVAPASDDLTALLSLRSASAIRERCRLVHQWVAGGRSQYFSLHEDRLDAVADYVAGVTRDNYPMLDVPYHSRWRHFMAGGIDRWDQFSKRMPTEDGVARARAAVDLVVVSVLLDAGAGADWRYREAESGLTFTRSEGLAIASLAMFRSGLFSSNPRQPYQVDGEALLALDAASLARGFQLAPDNPLVGVEPRLKLLHGLGAALLSRPDLFGKAPSRPGNLVDWCRKSNAKRDLTAAALLAVLLEGWSSIWPSGLTIAGVALGDAGRHPAAKYHDVTDGVVPFHKLTQWLTYSLIEPLSAAGISIADLDSLTALPEYRNGGLFIDLELLQLRNPVDAIRSHAVTSELVVEWRALTIVLLDLLRDRVAERLGLPPSAFPLAKLLQGGTWAAGRKIALTQRPPHGAPPIAFQADGTVF